MKIRIISLGEVIRPDMMKGVLSLSAKTGLPIPRIGAMLQEPAMVNLVTQFKLGRHPYGIAEEKEMLGSTEAPLSLREIERAFAGQFVERLNREALNPILPEDFLMFWHEMNPGHEQYDALLEEAIRFHAEPGNSLYFLSYTNSLDVRVMQENLLDVDPENPVTLADIPFYASYDRHLNAPGLLQKILEKILFPRVSSTLFGKGIPDRTEIAYVHTPFVNQANRFGTEGDAMLDVCRQMGIQHSVWDRANGMSLEEALSQASLPVQERRSEMEPSH